MYQTSALLSDTAHGQTARDAHDPVIDGGGRRKGALSSTDTLGAVRQRVRPHNDGGDATDRALKK